MKYCAYILVFILSGCSSSVGRAVYSMDIRPATFSAADESLGDEILALYNTSDAPIEHTNIEYEIEYKLDQLSSNIKRKEWDDAYVVMKEIKTLLQKDSTEHIAIIERMAGDTHE